MSQTEELRAECADCGHYEVFHAPSEDGACQTVDRATLLECNCERFRLDTDPFSGLRDYLEGENQQRELARDLAKQAAQWGRWAADESRPHTFDERCALSQSFALASIALSLAWRDQP